MVPVSVVKAEGEDEGEGVGGCGCGCGVGILPVMVSVGIWSIVTRGIPPAHTNICIGIKWLGSVF